MTTFIIIAVLGLAVAIAVVVAPLVLGRTDATTREQADAQVFRDQLAEIDRDLARGAINPEEAEGARIEVSRRLLRADKAAQATIAPGPKSLSRGIALVMFVAVPAVALGLYAQLGQPGLPGQPLAERMAAAAADRPTQEQAEAVAGLDPMPPITDPELASHLVQLEEVVANRPNDPEGQRLMGITQLRAGRYVAARKAFDRFLELAGEADANTNASHAEAMIMGAGGYVSAEAEQALGRALRIDPENQMARYYAGVALAQAGRVTQAVQLWERLRSEVPPNSPVFQSLNALIANAEGRLPSAGPGPSQQEIEAAQQMSPEEQAEFIASMVARREERLTTEGGEVEDWYQLMAMYMRIGRPEDALRIYEIGRDAQDLDSARSFLKEQALLLGLDVQ